MKQKKIFLSLRIKYVEPSMRNNRHNYELLEKEDETKENITEKSALKKLSTRIVKKLIEQIKNKGETFLKSLNESQVENIIVFADEQYYNKQTSYV